MDVQHDTKSKAPNKENTQDSVPRVRSTDLFCGGRRVIIEHDNEDYCLRLTRNQRLILTKS